MASHAPLEQCWKAHKHRHSSITRSSKQAHRLFACHQHTCRATGAHVRRALYKAEEHIFCESVQHSKADTLQKGSLLKCNWFDWQIKIVLRPKFKHIRLDTGHCKPHAAMSELLRHNMSRHSKQPFKHLQFLQPVCTARKGEMGLVQKDRTGASLGKSVLESSRKITNQGPHLRVSICHVLESSRQITNQGPHLRVASAMC